MRHKYKLKKLSRPTDQRLALLRGGVASLIQYGKIKTTVTRGKEIGKMTEKLITLGKKKTLAARRKIYQTLKNRTLVKKLEEISSGFSDKNGGYTRLTKIGVRRGDAAPLVLIEFT
ncbi:50S ribosomal protein L17 [candidate division WOR-1 bacterium RIFOXYA2_FULL_36_21]|uniref:50S ribosomal protein L17 n=1 Tax=candidate division WOR-1 bacterium RIFOXYB2_FULL_36_35 TaxID=1802578 RepID=A0A1F4S4Z7_UNCSA|nr:MAG: 50S ribosomal protein L17 [candidate division WOR-1 bacterium RIFOXYA2_FULL_36_21]OGC15506.1 MAG: 50S ribosomal protein L17 [candidate division WOR-1 bacterium RIFOXYB2_FULL_36_35]OGC21291.1 MAG: 50S ribosomal protein L17 [candidate division WOR-1 bacterium RIFOXYA12_FULL_36_13]